jgi:hypothetical protein
MGGTKMLKKIGLASLAIIGVVIVSFLVAPFLPSAQS